MTTLAIKNETLARFNNHCTTTKEPIVVMKNINKAYGTRIILKDFDLKINRGSKVALIGPSGSGKTTILRLLAGLESPSSGEIWVDDFRVWPEPASTNGSNNQGEKKKYRDTMLKIGMVFQQYNLFPHMRVIDNLTLAPQRVLGWDTTKAIQEARKYLDMVGLASFEQSWPTQLSGGQQQRVAIARALILNPKLLLLDEVTSALDPEMVGEVLRVIREISSSGDVTVMMVTHEMGFAADIADLILMFDQGKIIEEGDGKTMLANPKEERTQRFLSRILNTEGV